jgi:hypothetical protein
MAQKLNFSLKISLSIGLKISKMKQQNQNQITPKKWRSLSQTRVGCSRGESQVDLP